MKKKKNSNSSSTVGIFHIRSSSGRDKVRALIIAAAFLAAYGLLLTFTPLSFRYTSVNGSRYDPGGPAERDIVVANDIIYTDEEATATKIEAEQRLVPPVFKVSETVTEAVLANYKAVREIFTRNRFTEKDPQLVFTEIQATLPNEFSYEQIELLTLFPGVHEIFSAGRDILETLLTRGLINPAVVEEVFIPGVVEVWRWKEERYEKTILPKDEVITLETLPAAVRREAAELGVPAEYTGYIELLVTQLAETNAFYDEEETLVKKEKISKETSPVKKKLSSGELIVREGETVTEKIIAKINVLTGHSKRVNIYSLAGTGLFLLLLVIISVFLFRPPLTAIRLNNIQLIILLSLFLLFILSAFILDRTVQLDTWVPFAVLLPAAFFAMLISVIINTRISLYFVVGVSVTALFITRLDPVSFMFVFSSGIIANILVKNAEKRIELVRSVFILAALSGIIMLMLGALERIDVRYLLPAFGWGVAHGFASGIINLGVLPLFEHWLNIPTRFRLLELSDPNTPLLKKMLSLAPGTYSHSLNVANLAESACKEIGANPLLARVGAYYHDIGKIEQAEYFIENQKEANKLIGLNPSLSVSVIKSHVKIGIEKAKELKLPKAVIDIISQHHGSGLINYFYTEALKNEKNSKISKEDYSYSEPVPTSREAAVVMLADTVEAAVRTLKKPTLSKISKYVWDLFLYKITEQQLNNSELTLKDLETIKNIFVHILAGYFHARIEYPQTNGNGN